MADFLTAVKVVRSSELPPEHSLTPITTSKSSPSDSLPQPREREPGDKGHSEKAADTGYRDLNTPQDALEALRSQPDADVLLATLSKLSAAASPDNGFPGFSLSIPGPLQAQVVNCIVIDIIPTFWSSLRRKSATLLSSCLRNITGLNAFLAKLGPLSLEQIKTASEIRIYLEVLDSVIHGSDVISVMWSRLYKATTDNVYRLIIWKELCGLLGSGKITSIVAQAEDVAHRRDMTIRSATSWLAASSRYAAWLGASIATMIDHSDDDTATMDRAEAAALLLSKTLSLSSSNELIRAMLVQMLDGQAINFKRLMSQLPASAKRRFVEQVIRLLSVYLPPSAVALSAQDPDGGKQASAIAALVDALAKEDKDAHQHLVAMLCDPTQSTAVSQTARRAVVAVLAASSTEDLQTVLEKAMTTFSDRLFIDHAPALQQDNLAQTVLLAAGYLHRNMPMALKVIARSSRHIRGTSNRLDASGHRARWLGMVVAMAISRLVDKDEARMDFGTDEVKTEEAIFYMSLVELDDRVASLAGARSLFARPKSSNSSKTQSQATQEMPVVGGKRMLGPVPPPTAQTEVVGERITELLDDEFQEEDGLRPYPKPDSDPEDSDEDATLVNRNKPRPPVYIRDLLSMLKDDKDHDRFQLGVKHAAPLIRRKANFGKEVKDHTEELMAQLCNLQDPFETPDFDELRLQAMIALVLADVDVVALWLSAHVFLEGYSLSQRCTMLSALGLGGRELAGFKNEDTLNPALPNTDFPSKRLPPRLHAAYTASPVNRLESVSKNMEDQLIQPLALQAADQTTAHLNPVKVRTFSSRMEVERTKRKPAANQLAKTLGKTFFGPLISRYQQEVSAYGGASVFVSSVVVVVTFVKTLALLLHASGPATLGLPDVTAVFWDLLLEMRVQAAGNIKILEAVLFSFLTILDVNTDKRRLASEEAKRLGETQQWVEIIFEKAGGGEILSGGGDAQEEKVRMLAAGVLVRLSEVGEVARESLFGRSPA